MSRNGSPARPRTTIPELVPIGEAIERLGVSRATVFRMLADGELRRVKVRRRTFVPLEDVAALVVERSTPVFES